MESSVPRIVCCPGLSCPDPCVYTFRGFHLPNMANTSYLTAIDNIINTIIISGQFQCEKSIAV